MKTTKERMKIKQLDDTSAAAKSFSHVIDDFFKVLNQIENKLENENKYKLEFEYHAEKIQGIFIAWKRLPNTKKKRCRLYVKWVERDIERPLVELPVEVRLECAKYLFPFLKAFREFLQEKTNDIEDEVASMKAELECF